MDTSAVLSLVPYVLSAGTSVAIAIYAWDRTVAGSRQFALLALSQAVATIGFILEVSSDGLQTKLFWTNIQTIAFFAWPTAYLAFALKYTDHKLPEQRIWALLTAPFAVFLVLLFTDPLHGLIRPIAYIEEGEPFSALIIDFTLPIYLAGIYAYSFIIAAVYLLARKYLNPLPLYRGQVGTVLVGTLIPILVGILTTAGIRVGFQSDPTPITFVIGNLIVAWGLYRYRLFDLVPVARDSLVESMREGVVVLDLENRIVDVNPAAGELLGKGARSLVGKPADSAFDPWPELQRLIGNSEPSPIELTIEGGSKSRILEVSLMTIHERLGSRGGRMLLLHDISDLKRMDSELTKHRDELEFLVAERTEELTSANERLRKEIRERERAEHDLEASESRTIQFLDALPIAIIVVSSDTRLHYMNEFAMELYGRGRTSKPPVGLPHGRALAEVISELPTFMIGGQDPLPPDQSPSLRALQGERVRLDNVEVQLRDERLPLEMLSVPIRDESGEVEFAVTAIQEISERKRLEESLDGIYKLGRDMALIRDEGAIGRRVVEEVLHLLDFEMVGFGLADELTSELICAYSIHGVDEEEGVLRLPLDGKRPKSVSASVYRTGESMNVPDVSKEPLYHLETGDWQGRSELCVPIRVGERILGVLNAESRQLNRFSRDDERLLQTLADQCGVAVENARLYSELQQRLQEQTALQKAVSSISSKIELDDVLNEIVKRMGKAIDATSAVICSYDQTKMTMSILAHYASAEANEKTRTHVPEGEYSVPEHFPGTYQKLQAGKPAVSYPDDPKLPMKQRNHYKDYGTLASLFIPMQVGGRLVAYADLWDSRERRVFSPQEIALCEGIAQQAAVAMEHARLYAEAQDELIERRRIEERLQQHKEELEELVMERTAKLSEASERLATLNDASHVLGVASVNPQQVHIAIHKAVSWLMPAELFTITVFDHANGRAEDVYVADGEGSHSLPSYEIEGTFADYMLRTGESVLIEDVRLFSESIEPHSNYFDGGTQSALAVLLPGSERPMGVLRAQCEVCSAYGEEDVKILEMLAAHAATAIENAQLYQVVERAAADEERQRLARHLHDSVTQSLYSLTLMTNGWAAMSERGELHDATGSFRQLEELGVQALSEMRMLIHQLRPPVLEETGLVGALQERLEAVEHRVGVETQLQTEGDVDRIPRQVEEELFHISREALNNALRHAEASNVWVRLEVENGSARLAIEDNGCGFDPKNINAGLGLTSMRERAESVGGDFQLDSGAGKGTVVEVLLDLS